MCKKQKSLSHSSTESKIISLDAGLRLDGILALDLWDLIVFVLGNTNQNHDRTGKPFVCRDKNHVHQQSRGMFNVVNNVRRVPSNVQFSHQEALLYEVCSRIVVECLHQARIGDLTFCGQSTNWHDLSQNGLTHVTDDWHD